MMPQNIQDKIIDLYCYTTLEPYDILKIICKEYVITLEELYDFLYNYRTKDGEILKKQEDVIKEKTNKIIYELKIQGYSSGMISQALKEEN